MRTVFAVALVLFLAAPVLAKKPEPPSPPPTILVCSDGYAIDSEGNLYQGIGASNFSCSANLGASLMGNLFGGPPPHKVVGIWVNNGSPYVALESGDVYYWCTIYYPQPGYPVLAGNIFTAAGTVARLPDLPPLNLAAPAAPTTGDPDSPEGGPAGDRFVRPGAER